VSALDDFLAELGVSLDGDAPAGLAKLASEPPSLRRALAALGAPPNCTCPAAVRVAAARHLAVAAQGAPPDHGELAELLPRPSAGVPGVPDGVGVVVPCHDSGYLLLDALASLRLCEEELSEVVVVDDGSTDPATCVLLEEVEQLGLPVVRGEHGGPSRARNLGAKVTASPHLVFLDAEDLLRPGFAPAAAAELEARPGLGAVWAATWTFGALRELRPVPEIDVTRLLTGNYLDVFCMLRRDALADVGGWDEAFGVGEDWDLWLALVGRGWQLSRLDGAVVAGDHRLREGSLSTLLDDPSIRVELSVAVAEKHRATYARHLGGVVANYMSAVVLDWPAGTAEKDAPAAMAGPGELRSLLERAEKRAAGAELRRRELADELAVAKAETALQVEAAGAARRLVSQIDARRRAERAAADAELLAAREELATSRALGDAADSRAAGAVKRAEAERGEAVLRARSAEAELEALRATRSYRWLARPREAYGRARRFVRRLRRLT
jgi:Glycosyltransferase like family 2